MKKRFGKIQKLVTVVVSAVAVVASAMTVLAYEPLQSSNEEAIIYLTDDSCMDFVPLGEDTESFETDDINIDFSESDNVFVYDSGLTIPIIESNSGAYAICNHTFIDGTLYKHVPNGSGGCTMYVYTAQICSKCNYLKAQKLTSTHTYVTCPHNS